MLKSETYSSIELTWFLFVVGNGLTVGSFLLMNYAIEDWYLTTTFQHGVLDDEHFEAFMAAIITLPLGLIPTLCSVSRLAVYYQQRNMLLAGVGLMLYSATCLVLACVAFHAWQGHVWITWDTSQTSINAAKIVNAAYVVLLVLPLSLVLLRAGVCYILMYSSHNATLAAKHKNQLRSQQDLGRSLLNAPDVLDADAETAGAAGAAGTAGTAGTAGNAVDSGDAGDLEMQQIGGMGIQQRGQDEMKRSGNEAIGASRLCEDLGEVVDTLDGSDYFANKVMNNNDESCIYGEFGRRGLVYEVCLGRYLKYLLFGLILPLMFFLNGVLPSDWHKMTPAFVLAWVQTTSGSPWTHNIPFGSGQVWKWHWPVYTVYAFVLVVCVAGSLARKSLQVRRTLRIRIGFGLLYKGQSVTVGELICLALFLGLAVIHGYYWGVVHVYEEDETITGIEHLARMFGMFAMFFLMFLLFTVTRISLWIECFGVSFEHLVAVHRLFGYLVLICAYTHAGLFVAYFAQGCEGLCSTRNMLPFNPNPPVWHEDNQTVFMMYYLMIFVFPIGYALAFFYVRRHYFELFYYAHLVVSCIFFVATLWHASQSWRYVIPPLIVYFFDRCNRLYNSCQIGNVLLLKQVNRETTLLAWNVESVQSYNAKFEHACGQYCFINIPCIDPFEWHPFTISSAQDGKYTTMHIKSFRSESGSKQTWSSKLYDLAGAANSQTLESIEMHVDGPYGKSLDMEGYSQVLLIGGGIGVTPCHSIFATHLNAALRNGNNSDRTKITLIWVVRDQNLLQMYDYTWQKFERVQQVTDRFGVELFVTRSSKSMNKSNKTLQGTETMEWKNRRPMMLQDLRKYLKEGSTNDGTLIFVCGPELLVRSCERVATEYGAHFQTETFEF